MVTDQVEAGRRHQGRQLLQQLKGRDEHLNRPVIRIELLLADQTLSYEELQHRVDRQLQKLPTLPALPQIVLHLMKVVKDPDTTVEDVEKVLISEPAIVLKLRQVANSAAFAGIGRRKEWTLREVIVRLGLKRVGAVVQQIELMNRLIKPVRSDFDLHRFWRHSVGCALVANKLYSEKLLSIKKTVPFNDYWLGALLHDIGKLVLGFYFPHCFEATVQQVNQQRRPFFQVEAELGGGATHEHIGRILLLKSDVGPVLAELVATHHTVGDTPGELVCLIHLANTLGKEVGMGCLPEEPREYSRTVLDRLGLTLEDAARIRDSLNLKLNEEVEELVALCRSS